MTTKCTLSTVPFASRLPFRICLLKTRVHTLEGDPNFTGRLSARPCHHTYPSETKSWVDDPVEDDWSDLSRPL